MITTLLCDADGNLFPSEEPAFDASASVTNRFLESLGVERRYTATELRLATTGKNFRTTAADLAFAHGVPAERFEPTLEEWVAEERRAVTRHLATALSPDAEVRGALGELARRYDLAVVSSSASARVAACLEATALDAFFADEKRFSAEDSLPVPASKPDPAIYEFALTRLGIRAHEALAIEDAVPGVQSAVGAGLRTIGNLVFVPPAERATRRADLTAAGAAAIVDSWRELSTLVGSSTTASTGASRTTRARSTRSSSGAVSSARTSGWAARAEPAPSRPA